VIFANFPSQFYLRSFPGFPEISPNFQFLSVSLALRPYFSKHTMTTSRIALTLSATATKFSVALLAAAALSTAHAQNTPIKFQLDWRFEGPSALFLTPVAKGYFKEAKLDVVVDAGNGSGGAVTTLASLTWPP
jgi:hypothetical protein